jgi:hypothetical protein
LPAENIAIPDDSNINRKEIEKLSKYKDLEIDFSRMWKVRTRIVPIIITALGTIKKALGKKLQLLQGQQSAIVLHKFTLMSTANIICKLLGSIALISC